MAKRASDPASAATRNPAGVGSRGAPVPKTVQPRPAGVFESVPGCGGIPARLAELGWDSIAIIAGIAYLLASALEAGLTITQVLDKAKETGIVPADAWAKLKSDLDWAEAAFLGD